MTGELFVAILAPVLGFAGSLIGGFLIYRRQIAELKKERQAAELAARRSEEAATRNETALHDQIRTELFKQMQGELLRAYALTQTLREEIEVLRHQESDDIQ